MAASPSVSMCCAAIERTSARWAPEASQRCCLKWPSSIACWNSASACNQKRAALLRLLTSHRQPCKGIFMLLVDICHICGTQNETNVHQQNDYSSQCYQHSHICRWASASSSHASHCTEVLIRVDPLYRQKQASCTACESKF